ncbi:MAG: FkbM family methyltransferase [Deltaproteobacteria bacterium]|nr:FkbM family methyltransferase [Deltaproteobacteria bacterium]
MKQVELRLPFDNNIFHLYGSERDKSVIGAIESNHGYYEPHIMNFLKKIIGSHFVSIDIGANIGAISLPLSHIAASGIVYSFEASKNNFAYLRKNIMANNVKNIEPINMGIYDKKCQLDFSYVEEVAGCSFLSTVGVKEGVSEVIDCIRLDDWIIENNIQKVDFIKLDVEGAEIHAINGSLNTFKNLKPDLIVEFNPNPIERFFGEKPESLYFLLADIFPNIFLIDDGSGSLIEINSYPQLIDIVRTRKGWEDLYCSFR